MGPLERATLNHWTPVSTN